MPPALASGPALITGLLAAALLLAWLWRPRQPPEAGVAILVIAYGLLGAWALWFEVFAGSAQEPAALAVWKPTIVYWTLAAVMIAAPPLGGGYPVKAIVGAYFVFSKREWHWINLGVALLCAALGASNLVIAFAHTRDDWEGYKYSCMVNLLAIFLMRLTFVWVDALVRIVSRVHGRVKALLS
jgi:intracellular septation protein